MVDRILLGDVYMVKILRNYGPAIDIHGTVIYAIPLIFDILSVGYICVSIGLYCSLPVHRDIDL